VPAPCAGGTATFAGGVIMVPSLYVSYSESLTSLLSHLRDASSCFSVYLGPPVFSQKLPNLFCSGFLCLALPCPT
jgi:hypothetical protein